MLNRTRRACLQAMSLAVLPKISGAKTAQSNEPQHLLKKNIPSNSELLTVIGMGTWLTFDVGDDRQAQRDRAEILKVFVAMGGQLVDSSPMYGSSQRVIGEALRHLQDPAALFSADKIWTRDGNATRSQSQESATNWRVPHFDLLQVHNLLNWRAHLSRLQAMKQSGLVRYIGVTTSHGLRHPELEQIVRNEELDFIQLTYNLHDRQAEQRLLPMAADNGIAVIANRPFQGGALLDSLQRSRAPLPAWAGDFSCLNWPQLLLKYVVSHPSVVCAIPATRQRIHMIENMGAAIGPLLDTKHRRLMRTHISQL